MTTCILIGAGDNDIAATTDCLAKTMEALGQSVQVLAVAIVTAANTIPDISAELINNLSMRKTTMDGWDERPIKEKNQCHLLTLVLFLLAHKGILPLIRREINMREVPFGFV